MNKTFSLPGLVLLCVLVGASGCDTDGAVPTGTPPVVQLMPDLPGYRVVEGSSVQEYIAGLAEGAALLTMNPQMLVLIETVDSTIACYQEVGAVSMRIYNDEDAPLSSGAVAIADRNRLTDPQTLFRCIGSEISLFAQPAISPCAHNYTLERDNNAFYIVYVGTTDEICRAFCSSLEGCTEH